MIALLVVAMGASMAAAAAQVVFDPSSISNPLDGITVSDATVTVSITATGARTITLATTPTINARLVGNGIDTGWINGYVSTQYDATAGDYVYTLSVNGTAKGRVSVADHLGTTPPAPWDYANCDVGYGTADVDIPEFATLAIPVVALLGLVLFMRRKKD